jgi:hypothetical protein
VLSCSRAALDCALVCVNLLLMQLKLAVVYDMSGHGDINVVSEVDLGKAERRSTDVVIVTDTALQRQIAKIHFLLQC